MKKIKIKNTFEPYCYTLKFKPNNKVHHIYRTHIHAWVKCMRGKYKIFSPLFYSTISVPIDIRVIPNISSYLELKLSSYFF